MSPTDHRGRANLESHPPLTCWFCDRPSTVVAVIDNGILVSRDPRMGGPYRIFTCPYCLTDSMCEETPRGRWFASPNLKLGLLDYLFTWTTGGTGERESELILKAVSWLRENEERRRYYFERDGDGRYSGGSFLKRLWPWRREDVASAQDRRGSRRRRADSTHRARARGAQERASSRPGGARADGASGERRSRRPSPSRIVSPHEILGLPADATLEEIQKQFHRLAVKYHPDKVHHLGDTFRDEAHRKFVSMQRAYRALLRRDRGDGESGG